ncbi:hypothetical protein [Pedobacter sp. WC2423]|uniref:hypothetical protein n=1 Tax=Pedobacter sp. WC2423 TaxID=3234142 RepID=UPI00346552E9
MLDKIFEVDFNRLISLNLPVDLRQLKWLTWLQCLVSPVKMIDSKFKAFRSANLYTLAHNGQVCFLRKVLNDSFDPGLRRIYIAEGSKYDRNYIYTNAEKQPKYLGKMYLRQASDYADSGVDFRVIIPIGFNLNAVIHQMKAAIDFYKLASKRYKIEYDE